MKDATAVFVHFGRCSDILSGRIEPAVTGIEKYTELVKHMLIVFI